MRKAERGFSLLEVLVAAIVFTVISGGVVGVLYQSQRAFQNQGDFNQAGVDARIALDQIVRSLRYAGNDPLGGLEAGGIQAVDILGSGHFRINSDITGSVDSQTANLKEKTGEPDGLLDAIYEVVEYRYDSGSQILMVNVGYGEVTLVENISDFEVLYYDSTGFLTTNAAEVARVRVRMVAATEDVDSWTGQKNLVTLRSDVMLRATTFDLFSLFSN